MRWFCHVERLDDEWIKKCTVIEVEGSRLRGRPKKWWVKVIQSDIKELGFKKTDAVERDAWRAGISGTGIGRESRSYQPRFI